MKFSMNYSKKCSIFLAGILLVLPTYSFADNSALIVKLLEQIRVLQIQLNELMASRTTAVHFDPISPSIGRGDLVTFTFKRTPTNSSSHINFSIETGNNIVVGTLANEVETNSIRWEVANNFIVGRSYLISARDEYNNLLGKSGSFVIASSSPVVSPPVIPVSSTSALYVPTAAEISSADINNGSVGYWSFDRYSNICETKGSAVTNVDGKFGSALGIDGINSYCIVYNNKTNYPKNFTIALWAKSAQVFADAWNDSGWFISLRDQSGFNIGPVNHGKSIKFTILDDTNMVQIPYIAGTVTPDDISMWHHYAMTYDGSSVKIYLDGVLATSSAMAISRSYAGNKDLYFGVDNNSDGQHFGGGSLDEIRLYNRPLSTCEIQILAGKGCN